MGPRDYISSLPDEILGKILSSLCTQEAACTSVLSKRWRNLLALVDNLDIHGVDHPGFYDFVDNTLALLSNSPPIKRVSLSSPGLDPRARTYGWLRTVLDRGCSELYLYRVPLNRDFFTNNPLVKLTISHMYFQEYIPPRGAVIFPSLKTLSLVSVDYTDEFGLENLLSGCPVLEDLSLRDDRHYYAHKDGVEIVSSPSIKRLTIFYEFSKDINRDKLNSYFLDNLADYNLNLPSLVYLDFSSFVSELYVLHLPSLVEARLDLRSWVVEEDETHAYKESEDVHEYCHDDYCEHDFDEVKILFGDITDLLKGISTVKTLHLSATSLEVFHYCCKSMPVFHNLLTLSFESHKDKGWQALPRILNHSPNLETLVIKGLDHKVLNSCGDACGCIPMHMKMKMKTCCLSTCRVKVLKILGYRGNPREMVQMKHFLANLKYLEIVMVGVEHKDAVITEALMLFPRISSNCQFHFFNFSFPPS